MKTYLHIVVFLSLMVVGCSRPFDDKVEEVATPSLLKLSAIDSLMWKQPDGALKVMMEFAESEAANSMDVFEGHYCQLLISELLYKNYYEQSNREDLLKAVGYFDSLTAETDGVDTRGVFLRRGDGTAVKEKNVFLDARAHYINGAGCYEEGNVVRACEEYLMTLELMESYFIEEDLIGFKAQFMALTYNRLGDLFSEQFMMESAVDCYECALVYCRIESTSPQGVPSIIYRIGQQYDMMGEKEKAREYYEKAVDEISCDDNLWYRDLASIVALCDYQLDSNASLFFNNMKQILAKAEDEKERLARCLALGAVYFEEKMYDSAVYYLVPVFYNDDEATRIQAAEYLHSLYQKIGDSIKSDTCARFLANHKKSEGEDKALVSKLEAMFKNYQNKKQERQAEIEREKAMKKALGVIIPIIVVVLVVYFVLILRNKKQLKEQQEEADRVLGEKEQEHEKELKQWQLEAQKEIDERERQHTETVKKQQEETIRQAREILPQRASDLYHSIVPNRLERIMDEFEAAYPKVMERLAVAHPELNERERQIAVLNFLRFRAKEEAELTGFAENTILKYRSNLNKKAGSDPISALIEE